MAIEKHELEKIPKGTSKETCYWRILSWHKDVGEKRVFDKFPSSADYFGDYLRYIEEIRGNPYDPKHFKEQINRLFKEQIMGLREWAYHERDDHGIKLGAYAHYVIEKII